jgi:hypothetical protein
MASNHVTDAQRIADLEGQLTSYEKQVVGLQNQNEALQLQIHEIQQALNDKDDTDSNKDSTDNAAGAHFAVKLVPQLLTTIETATMCTFKTVAALKKKTSGQLPADIRTWVSRHHVHKMRLSYILTFHKKELEQVCVPSSPYTNRELMFC